MKASEILVGDRIRVTFKAPSGDITAREFDVAQISPYPTTGGEGVLVRSVSRSIRVILETPRDTIELINRPKTPGEQAFDGFYSEHSVFRPEWSALSENEKNRWESAAQRVLDNCKD